MIYKILFIVIICLSNSLNANDVDVKVIDLHKSKSLDQLVLENEYKKNNDVLSEEDETTIFSEETEDELSQNGDTLITDDIKSYEDNTISEISTATEVVNILNNKTIFDIDEKIIINHLSSIQDIKSKTLQREFIKILSNINLENDNIDFDKVFFITKKLYEIGEIEEANNLVMKIKLDNVSSERNLNFFYFIKLNYLLSSYKLNEVCELRSFILQNSINLPKNLIEKTDIFCLTLENKYSEANLLNSLLIDSEQEEDRNFQKLFKFMNINNENNADEVFYLSDIDGSKELIFLYSAMLRINELPLYEDFIKVDPLNLSIPVILSETTDMSIRIKAANKAYFDDVLSINSLSALYQSVDFNSKQFSNPDETIATLNNSELIMAYYYQLVNIQIFPNERLDILLKYWKFAKKEGLEKIAYAITEKIVDSFSPTSENSKFAKDISIAHIANKNFDEAVKWIELYEIYKSNDESIDYVKFLIDLNKNDDLSTMINYFSSNYNKFKKNGDQRTEESLEVLINFLSIQNIIRENVGFIEISDERNMPSYFLMRDIEQNIVLKDDLSLFLLSLISMQNKKWTELHPEHFKLILEAFGNYENGILKKLIILEIFNELELF